MQSNTASGVGRSGSSTVAGADRHRKRHRIAEPVGEEQLRGREHHVVGADADDALAHQPRGRHQAGVDVPHRLGLAGRTRGVQPERDLVRHGRRTRRRLGAREHVLEPVHAGRERASPSGAPTTTMARRCGSRARIASSMSSIGAAITARCGAAVGEQVAVLLGGQQRVDRDRHDAGADRAPERHRIVDGVVQQQDDAVLPRAARGS